MALSLPASAKFLNIDAHNFAASCAREYVPGIFSEKAACRSATVFPLSIALSKVVILETDQGGLGFMFCTVLKKPSAARGDIVANSRST